VGQSDVQADVQESPRRPWWRRPRPLALLAALVLVVVGTQGHSGAVDHEAADSVAQGEPTYAFLDRAPDGSPVGFRPCEPVAFEVNPAGAPPGWREIVRSAAAQVQAASKFRLLDEGTTDRRPSDPLRGSEPVLVSWSQDTETDGLAGRVVGLGGSAAYDDGRGARFYTTGRITLDAVAFGRYVEDGDVASARAVLMHEWGHVLGLAHVDDDGELMNAANLGRTRFGDGDRLGFAALRGTEC